MANSDEQVEKAWRHTGAAKEILIWARVNSRTNDNVSKVLRLHALTDFYLERILQLHLKNASAVLEDGRFSYFHKRLLVEAIGALPTNILESLKRLTVLRNKCAHSPFPEITESDVRHAAEPILEAVETARIDFAQDGACVDEMGLFSWALFSEISLRIAPQEVVNAELAAYMEMPKEINQ